MLMLNKIFSSIEICVVHLSKLLSETLPAGRIGSCHKKKFGVVIVDS